MDKDKIKQLMPNRWLLAALFLGLMLFDWWMVGYSIRDL